MAADNEHELNDQTHSETELEASREAQPPTSTPQLTGWRLKTVLAAVFVGLFLSFLDTTIVAVALPTIASRFDGFDRSAWVINAYLLTYMAFSIVLSRMSDIFGRKTVEAFSMIMFMVFSLGCALSKSMTQLIILRALQGIGGSGMYSSCFVIALTVIPPQRRSIMSGIISICVVSAGVLGPILGGAITHDPRKDTWPWVFWINLPIASSALVALLVAWPSDKTKKTFTLAALSSVDFLGSLLLLAASVLLVFALQEGGAFVYAWNSAAIIISLVLAGVSFVCFVGWEQWLHAHPKFRVQVVFPVNLFSRRVIAGGMIATTLSGFTYYVAVVNLPQRFQIVSRDSPIIAGLRLLPMLVFSAVGAVTGGVLSAKRNNTAFTLVAAAASQVLGYGLMTTIGDTTSVPAKLYGFQIFLGLGFGLSMSSATQMINLQVEPRWLAVTQGALAQIRTLGGSIGLASAVIVFNYKIRSSQALQASLSPSQTNQLYKSPLVTETLTPEQQQLVAITFAKAFKQQMQVATYIAAACFVSSLFTLERHPPNYPHNQKPRADAEPKAEAEAPQSLTKSEPEETTAPIDKTTQQ